MAHDDTNGTFQTTIDNDSGSTLYVYLLAFVATLGGLLFGYDTAVISGAIGYMRDYFQLNAMWAGWAASSALVGCIIGAGCAGVVSDRLGRKTALIVAAVLFFISAVGSAIPRNLTEFAIARIVGGVGVGIASMLSPLYIAEVAPASIRGRLVSLNQIAIVVGMLVVYYVNTLVAGMGDEAWNVQRGWRWMFGSEAFPAALFWILLYFVPESPRWLTKQGSAEKAFSILSRIRGRHQAQQEIDDIQATLEQESGSLRQLFQPGIRTALFIGIALAILQQVTGINVVLYFAPEIFKSTGVVASKAINDTVIIGVVMVLFTLVAIWVVDRLGRKPLLLLTSAGMGISLGLLGRAFLYEQFEGPWVLVYILTYVASFSIAMGPVVWVVMSEIFPTRTRGRAMSIATVCLWTANFIVSQTFLDFLERFQGAVFFIYASMCAIAFIFVALFVPETKGRTLEDIERSWLERKG